jgi:antirestriction protein ArdC
MTTSSKERFDVYGAITDQIIASIEAGAASGNSLPQMPWHRAGGSIERLSRRQHRRPLGIGILPAIQSWPLGHISPVARTRRSSPQGREIVHHHFLS